MKKTVMVLFLVALVGCSKKEAAEVQTPKPAPTPAAESGTSMASDTAREKALAYFKSKEPKVKDAIFTQPSVFKVGVLDDGSRRDGYAQYVCSKLEDFGLKGQVSMVKVIDIALLNRTGEWKDLGEAEC